MLAAREWFLQLGRCNMTRKEVYTQFLHVRLWVPVRTCLGYAKAFAREILRREVKYKSYFLTKNNHVFLRAWPPTRVCGTQTILHITYKCSDLLLGVA